MTDKQLPIIHNLSERDSEKWLRLEQLDLEFSNGEKRVYYRMRTRGLGAVIIVPMLDDDTVLLAREYAAGLHHYEIGLPKGRLEEGDSIVFKASLPHRWYNTFAGQTRVLWVVSPAPNLG